MNVNRKTATEPDRRAAVAAAVLQLRRRQNLSQVALAAKAGTSIGTVANAERGGFLTPVTAAKLAVALGVTTADLLVE